LVYNYFITQLQIRIEMAFGLLSSKWSIFHWALETQSEGTMQVRMSCARLHHFMIENEWEDLYVEGAMDDNDASNNTDLEESSMILEQFCWLPPKQGATFGE
jgi:hypothetical protein